MEKNKWTRNQIILLVTAIIAILALIPQYVTLLQIKHQQVAMNQDLNEIKAKSGIFDILSADNASIPYIKVGNATLYYNGSCFVSTGDTSTLYIC